jgi:hypothetical protein
VVFALSLGNSAQKEGTKWVFSFLTCGKSSTGDFISAPEAARA